MKINTRTSVFTHEGAKAVQEVPYERLKRTVLACMLFEDSFYEDGKKAVDRIIELCARCTCQQVLDLALLASEKYGIRHVPLQLIVEALKHKNKPANFSDYIDKIIKRPDMMTDLLALYWKDKRVPLAYQLKKGLAKAFCKFDEYQLAKYNRDNPIKLRDVLFLTHAKPKNEEMAAMWKRLVNKELKTPDTWEVRLSAGEDKQESFVDLLKNGKMGKLAILRNLRNMQESGVPKELVASELHRNMKEMLPFQYIAASRECPAWEDIIDPAMVKACSLKPKILGKTLVLVDVSGSMDSPISNKSKMMRMDAACGMAILLKECCPDAIIFSFSDGLALIPPRQGMALRDAIVKSQTHNGTMMGAAIYAAIKWSGTYDRIIVITDEQSHDQIPPVSPFLKHYILNIASYQNGVGRKDQWTTISGFSEASIDFIREYESMESNEKNP